jgi:hypothetical protein
VLARQKKYLAEAAVLHKAASRRKEVARRRLKQRRQEFLGEPLNLLYPYIAGILICASQLKNDAAGLKRIPFMNIAKAGVGVWTLISRIRKIRDKRSSEEDHINVSSHNRLS